MRRLTLKNLLERTLTSTEEGTKEKLVKKFKKSPYFKGLPTEKRSSAIYGTATKVAKATSESVDVRTRVIDALLNEEVVNKDHQPMTQAEISARNRCYKGSKMKPGPTLKNNDSPANSKARKCTFAILRSTRGGGGGALTTGWSKYKKKKKKSSKKSSKKS
jgi:hypothetical protein